MSEASSLRPLQITIAALAVVMVIYHLVSTQYLLLTTMGHKNAHLGLSLMLVFLSAMQRKKRVWPMMLLLVLFSILSTSYVHIFEDALHPYTKLLISSLPTLEDKKDFVGIPGLPPRLLDLPSGCVFHPRCPSVMDRCRTEVPTYIEARPNRSVRCHLYANNTGAAE